MLPILQVYGEFRKRKKPVFLHLEQDLLRILVEFHFSKAFLSQLKNEIDIYRNIIFTILSWLMWQHDYIN